MDTVVLGAIGAGTTSGLLALLARRAPIAAWIALCPLGLAIQLCGARAAIAGALMGAFLHGSVTLSQPGHLRPLGFLFGGVGWGLAAGLAGLLLETLRASHTAEGVVLACALPSVTLLATLPMRLAGAPRWIHAALACTQEPWPVVIRAGWVGGDGTVSVLLSLSAAAACLLLPDVGSPGLAAVLGAFIVAVLGTSSRSLARTRRSIERLPRVRIAAVVVDGAPPEGALSGLWPMLSPQYRDIDATIARYTPHIEHAARERAELIVLPECAVFAQDDGVTRWLDAVASWSKTHDVVIVAPHYDPRTANTLTVIEPSGRRSTYDKQHPAPGFEPSPRQRQTPGPHLLERGWRMSAVICVDLDYADIIAPLRHAPGLLVVPANDWPGFQELHDRSAVWTAVLTERTVLRATGHGVCSARDGAGALLARASSLDGPTVLIVDAPLTSDVDVP